MSQSILDLAVFNEGREVSNEWGSCWVFTYDAAAIAPPQREFDDFDNHLQAVMGIGPVREKKLYTAGIKTVSELSRTFEQRAILEDAASVCVALKEKNWSFIYERFPKFMVLGAMPRDKIAVVDIETSGFGFAMPIFLVGILTLTPRPLVKLFLARHPQEEPAMLKEAAKELEDKIAVISYNGASFDLPVLSKRCIRADVEFKRPLNLDLLPIVRRLLGQEVPDCRLKTIEKLVLEYERHQDPNSSDIPMIYQQFFMEQNPSLLLDVISHNARDLESLIWIWNYLEKRDRRVGFKF